MVIWRCCLWNLQMRRLLYYCLLLVHSFIKCVNFFPTLSYSHSLCVVAAPWSHVTVISTRISIKIILLLSIACCCCINDHGRRVSQDRWFMAFENSQSLVSLVTRMKFVEKGRIFVLILIIVFFCSWQQLPKDRATMNEICEFLTQHK